VAHEAGLGVGTAYRHFANKHELANAVAQQSVDRLLEKLRELNAMDDPWLAVVGFFEYALEMQHQDRGVRETLTGTYVWEEFQPQLMAVMKPMEQLVQRAQDAGVVRKDITATDIGIVLMMICSLGEFAEDAHPDLLARYLTMMLEGLKPGGAALPAPPLDSEQLFATITKHKNYAPPRAR
jgi:AcrR family transcriptional regulator